jgi:hypothetical protein
LLNAFVYFDFLKTGARSGNNTFCVVELNHNEPSMHYIDIRSTTTFKKSLEILSVFFVFDGTYVSKNQLDASLLPWPQELNVCCSASSDVMSNVYINCDIDSHSSDVEKHYYICKFEFGLGDRCGISEKTKVLESVTFSPIISSLCLLPASKSLNDANAATNKRKDADGEIGIDTYMDSDSEKRKRTPIKKSDTDNNNSDDEQDDNDSNAGYDENNESNNLKGGDICFIYKESPGGDRMQHINKALYWNGQNVDNTMVRNFTQATWLRDLVEITQPQQKNVNMYRMNCHNNNDMKHLLAKFGPTTMLLPHPNPNNENNHTNFTLNTKTLSLVMNYSATNSTPIIMPFDTDVRVDSDGIEIEGTDGAMHLYCDNDGRKIPHPKQLTAFLSLLKESTLYNFGDVNAMLKVMMNKHTLYFGPMHIESTNKLLLVHPTYGVVNRTGCELNKNRL